jgi:hypothetical protein
MQVSRLARNACWVTSSARASGSAEIARKRSGVSAPGSALRGQRFEYLTRSPCDPVTVEER